MTLAANLTLYRLLQVYLIKWRRAYGCSMHGNDGVEPARQIHNASMIVLTFRDDALRGRS